MTIRAVIFDLGGVLARTEDRSPREKLAARFGVDYKRLSDAVFENQFARLATIGKASDDEIWLEACRLLNVPVTELQAFKDAFWAGDVLDLELVDYIRSLRPERKTGLLSNAWPNLRKVISAHWGIIDAFDAVVISAEEGLAKPDPGIYSIAVQRLNVAPDEAVFVDDVPRNIEAAGSAGLHGIVFRSATQVRSELEDLFNGR